VNSCYVDVIVYGYLLLILVDNSLSVLKCPHSSIRGYGLRLLNLLLECRLMCLSVLRVAFI
jgi:hypothetical protein